MCVERDHINEEPAPPLCFSSLEDVTFVAEEADPYVGDRVLLTQV